MWMRNTILASGKWRVASSRSANAANYGTPTSHSPLATSHTYRSAFTLIELLVYMAILGFIIVVAGRVFSDATGMRVRTQNMTKSAEEANRIANLIAEDVSQMGAKVCVNSVGNYDINETVYIAGTPNYDSSSFTLYREWKDEPYDSLAFIKANCPLTPQPPGSSVPADTISWWVKSGKELYRMNRNKDTVLMARDVEKFKFYVSDSVDKDTVFPGGDFRFASLAGGTTASSISFTAIGSGESTVLERTVFASNSSSSGSSYNEVYFVAGSDPQAACLPLGIKSGETYAVEFDMPFPSASSTTDLNAARADSLSSQFQPNKDHIAVGLRRTDGNKVSGISPDVLIYASAEDAPRHRYAEFSANFPSDITPPEICIALTFAFYSSMASYGKLQFKNFKIYKKQTGGAYLFVKESNDYDEEFVKRYATETSYADKLRDKRNVKAFELNLGIKKKGEVGSAAVTIPVPNNGVAL